MSKLPRWLPVGEHGAVLKDAAGLVYGSVRRHSLSSTLWIGCALFDPVDLHTVSEPTESTAIVLHDHARSHLSPSKERAMEFVVEALQSAGRL